MKSGICPKCGSQEIVKFEPKKAQANSSAWDYENLSAFSNAYTTRYACLNCGYTERYFEKKELEKVKGKFEK